MIYGSRNSLLLGLLSPPLAAISRHDARRRRRLFRRLVDRVICARRRPAARLPGLLLGILDRGGAGRRLLEHRRRHRRRLRAGFARVARASTLAVQHEPFVEAAVAAGVQPCRASSCATSCPTSPAPVVVLMTLWIASAIRLEASLSFLGIGTQPPQPSWGNIIRDGLNNLFGSPWPIIGAGVRDHHRRARLQPDRRRGARRARSGDARDDGAAARGPATSRSSSARRAAPSASSTASASTSSRGRVPSASSASPARASR